MTDKETAVTAAKTELPATLETAENEVSYWAGQMAMNILRIGRALKVIRDGELYREGGYDSFAAYLDARAFKGWTIGQTQGYKYVKVFERYGNRLESLGCSNLEVLYLLKDAPEEDIEKLSESGELSNMTVSDARDYKKELEAANEQISLLSGDNEQKSAELESEKQAADRLSKDLRAAKKELEALRRERDELKDRPIEVAQPSDEDIEKIRADARAEIKKEYEQQTADRLKAAAAAEKARYDEESAKLRETLDKLTAEKESSDSRIKELERSLQSAEKSSDKPAADENLIEFKFYFSETQENLKKFLAVIDKVGDPGQREKFRGAAKKFITAILDDLGG
jgi:DNA repair exonuclease SbcCD ATPase subunit